MDPLRDIGVIDKLGRRALVGRVDRLSDWPHIAPDSGNRFVLLLATEGDAPSIDELNALAEDLLARGCACFAAWSPGCAQAETSIDGVVIQRWYVDAGREISCDGPIIPTTSHEDDSLRQAIWFFLNLTRPDDSMAQGVEIAIALVYGSPQLLQEVVDTFHADLDSDPD